MDKLKTRKGKLFNKSECRSGWLHRFVLSRQFFEGQEEICEICKVKVFFRQIEGRVNNQEYIAYHMRQCLFPQHRLFKKEFPNSNAR